MKRFNLSAWAVSHPALILFLIVALSVAGFFSYQQLGRAEDPFFTVKVVDVSAIWPGATAVEMQAQVADPDREEAAGIAVLREGADLFEAGLHRDAGDVPGLHAAEGSAVPVLSAAQEDRRRAGKLPQGLLGPAVNDEFSDVDSILYMMTGEGADYAQLKKAAEGMRQRLLKVPDVTKVNIYGTQDERIFVEFSHAKLATLGLDAAGAVRFAGQAEHCRAGRHGRDLVAARAAARHRCARRRQGGRGDAG